MRQLSNHTGAFIKILNISMLSWKRKEKYKICDILHKEFYEEHKLEKKIIKIGWKISVPYKKQKHFFGIFRSLISMVDFQSKRKKRINFVGDHPLNILTKFGSNWPSGFREEDWNVKVYGRRPGWTQNDDNTSHDHLGHMDWKSNISSPPTTIQVGKMVPLLEVMH